MSCYITKAKNIFPQIPGFHFHLKADSLVELNSMAHLLGIGIDRLDDESFDPHYDLTVFEMQKAIKQGVVKRW